LINYSYFYFIAVKFNGSFKKEFDGNNKTLIFNLFSETNYLIYFNCSAKSLD